MDKYEIIKRLGCGAHGSVYHVKHKSSKKFFALKKIEIDDRKRNRTKEAVLKEASILSQLRHPHIVLFHESFVDPTEYYVCLILDLCDGGTLCDRIQGASQNNLMFTEKQIMQWFIQIVMAVQYIHSKHILHRDLKSENVFLNKRNVVKLGDFGISKVLDNTIDVAKTVVGTPSYLSPELCQDIPYNSKSDIWAIGCLLYEMCVLHPPFDGQSLIGLFFNIIKADYQPLPEDTPQGIKSLISSILVKTPEGRPSASAILNVPYVKSHLASFIADTESIRSIRGRKDNIASYSVDGSLSLQPGMIEASHEVANHYQPPHLRRLAKPKASPVSVPAISPIFKADGSDKAPAQYPDTNLVQPSAPPLCDEADYSDDFDSSASEIEEDLPDPAEGAASDDDAQYADDFEDFDSDEDLDEVVNQAKEAQELKPVDDFFMEEDDDLALSQTLTQTNVFKSNLEAAKSRIYTDSTKL